MNRPDSGNPYRKVIEEEMRSCRLCPRKCGADRMEGHTGFCGMTAEIWAARAALHFWEEPCISGYPDHGGACGEGETGSPPAEKRNGSGTVFFSGCNLGCVYCQNRTIAKGKAGRTISQERLTEIFLELQEKGACNINLVTPTPYIPQIASAVFEARKRGLLLPVVFNCGGYESVDALRLLEGIVDIYLTDFKYMSPETSGRYSNAPDYPEAAKAALDEMVRQTGPAQFDPYGRMNRGVIVRHLLLPGHVREAEEVADYVYGRHGDSVWLSLMRQYTPMDGIKESYPELGRPVTGREYRRLLAHVTAGGAENCYIQGRGTAEESFIPAFDGEGL